MNQRDRWCKYLGAAVVFGAFVLSSGTAHGESHQYIMMMRSSTDAHIFVSQSADGTYGSFTQVSGGSGPGVSAIRRSSGDHNTWQGYELKTTLGIELMKFISFSLGHDSVSLRSADDSQENLRGSKLVGESKLGFVSPVGNLEFGGALTGARYDYQRSLQTGGYYGSGFYYLIGWNYFMSYRVSVFSSVKLAQEHLVPNGGDDTLPTMETNMTHLGVGFSLWL